MCNFKVSCPTMSLLTDSFFCKTSLENLTNDILWAMEYQKVTVMMAFNLLEAFNNVDHEILLEVLNKQYDISGNVLKWFSNYLRARSFCVHIGKGYILINFRKISL